MAAVTAPSGGSLLGKLAGLAAARAKARGRVSRLASAVGDHLLTVAALGAGDAAAWLHGPTWGLVATMGALLIIDFKLQG